MQSHCFFSALKGFPPQLVEYYSFTSRTIVIADDKAGRLPLYHFNVSDIYICVRIAAAYSNSGRTRAKPKS